MPFLLDVGVASTRRIAAGWGIASLEAEARAEAPAEEQPQPEPPPFARPMWNDDRSAAINRTIEGALRQAGLLR
jgi:hypothetical protein